MLDDIFEEQTSGDGCVLQSKIMFCWPSLPWNMHFNYTLMVSVVPTYPWKWLCSLHLANQRWGMDSENQDWPRKLFCVWFLFLNVQLTQSSLWDTLWFGEIGKYLPPQITNLGRGGPHMFHKARHTHIPFPPQAFWLNVNQSLGFLFYMLIWAFSTAAGCRRGFTEEWFHISDEPQDVNKTHPLSHIWQSLKQECSSKPAASRSSPNHSNRLFPMGAAMWITWKKNRPQDKSVLKKSKIGLNCHKE